MSASSRCGGAVAILFALAFAAMAQSQYPQPDSSTDVGDWVVECYGKGADERCQVYQRVLMNKATAIALVATFTYKDTVDELAYQIAVPLGVKLSQPALLALGPDYAIALPVSRCTQQGCLLEGIISGDALARLLKAQTASITVVNPASGNFQIPMSLNGFTRARASIAPRSAKAGGSIKPITDDAARKQTGDVRSVEPAETEPADDQLWPVTGNQRRQEEAPRD